MRWADLEDASYEYGDAELEMKRTAPPPTWQPLPCKTGKDAPPTPNPRTRGVTSAKVTCPTRAGATGALRAAVAKAVRMLDNTIGELTRARDAACRGAPLGWPNMGDVTACWLKYKLGVCIDDPAAWTAGTFETRSVAEVLRRLVAPRNLLATNQITYVCEVDCLDPLDYAWVTVREGGKCIPGTPPMIIHLCPRFWNTNHAPYRAQTIIHEAVHLTHCAAGTEDTATGVSIGSPECVAQFVAATNGVKLDREFIERCSFTNRCGAIPRDAMRRNCGAELGRVIPDWKP